VRAVDIADGGSVRHREVDEDEEALGEYLLVGAIR
jgi:hypothetical protein